MKNNCRHEEALRHLDQLRARGQISLGRYEVDRADLLEEMEPIPPYVKVIGYAGLIVLIGYVGWVLFAMATRL